MLLLPILFFACAVLAIGAAIGYGVAILCTTSAVWWLAAATVLGIVGAAHQIKVSNSEGDGGMGDGLIAVVLILLVVGAWCGFVYWRFA